MLLIGLLNFLLMLKQSISSKDETQYLKSLRCSLFLKTANHIPSYDLSLIRTSDLFSFKIKN